MTRSTVVRRYGKAAKPTRGEQLFAELPKSPVKAASEPEDILDFITDQLVSISLNDQLPHVEEDHDKPLEEYAGSETPEADSQEFEDSSFQDSSQFYDGNLRVLTWDDVCPFGDRIEKIAEASYAEVYRITNERGTSIIKVIRLESPIRPQTKAQEKSGLVDEEPHSEDDLVGEIRISEWLADIPGFVVYKERYIVQGKAPKPLLETHQTFHRKAKRKDPDRLQFYPSPSRYLEDTQFLVVELGDAGVALEDFELTSTAQLWDIFLHTAIALARAEDLVMFEHRDLHEGNICVRQVGESRAKKDESLCQFGYSGLDITILDYGLSRAEDVDDESDNFATVAYDLEKDLSIFTSTHAPQCKVYRQMRSFLLKGDRACLPPKSHTKPYEFGPDGPISWSGYYPYTNILWLAYIYQHLVANYQGEKKELAQFKRSTKEFWAHLNPEAPRGVLSFPSAGDAVRYAVEAGWITEVQLMGDASRIDNTDLASVAYNESIIEASLPEVEDAHLRRSPRRRRQRSEE